MRPLLSLCVPSRQILIPTCCNPLRFDFQSGDIIAVTATPDDGWWSGELLDETRRRPGQNTFPSNFVTMFVVLPFLIHHPLSSSTSADELRLSACSAGRF